MVSDLKSRHCPKKSWGWEEWIVNNDLYCGKRLHFTVVNGATSLHFHMKKHETMYAEKGEFDIVIVDPETTIHRTHRLKKGDSIVIAPGTVHRIRCVHLEPQSIDGEAVLVEFSTHHEDSDSYRVSL